MSEHEEQGEGGSENQSSYNQTTDCYFKNRDFHFHDPSTTLRATFLQAPIRPKTSAAVLGVAKGPLKHSENRATPLKGNHALMGKGQGAQDGQTADKGQQGKKAWGQAKQEVRNAGGHRVEIRVETQNKLRATRMQHKIDRASREGKEEIAGKGIRSQRSAQSLQISKSQRLHESSAKKNLRTQGEVSDPKRSKRFETEVEIQSIPNGFRRAGSVHNRYAIQLYQRLYTMKTQSQREQELEAIAKRKLLQTQQAASLRRSREDGSRQKLKRDLAQEPNTLRESKNHQKSNPALIEDFMRRNTAWQIKKDQNIKALWQSKQVDELGSCTFFPETHSYIRDEYSSWPNPLVPFENEPEYKIVLQGKTFELQKDPGIQEVLRSSAHRSVQRSIFKKNPIAESLVAE